MVMVAVSFPVLRVRRFSGVKISSWRSKGKIGEVRAKRGKNSRD
jgi:hypothetical protein